MKKNLFLLSFLICLFLLSCASSNFKSDFSPVYVTNSSKYSLLPPSSMSGEIDGLQRMTASFGDKSFDFDVYAISDKKMLSMTVLNEFGTTMASLFYDGSVLNFDSALFPKKIKAEYIVADFQFCLYDEVDLKSKLNEIGLDLEFSIENSEDGKVRETRILRKKDEKISKITKISDISVQETERHIQSIHYENFLRGYSYTLTGVES